MVKVVKVSQIRSSRDEFLKNIEDCISGDFNLDFYRVATFGAHPYVPSLVALYHKKRGRFATVSRWYDIGIEVPDDCNPENMHRIFVGNSEYTNLAIDIASKIEKKYSASIDVVVKTE